MKSFLLLLATVASAWAADISNFKSISVQSNAYVGSLSPSKLVGTDASTNLVSSGISFPGLTNLTVPGKLTVSGGTETTSNPVLDISQTWNQAGTTFTGIKANFTSAASAAASLLMDLQLDNTSKFKFGKDGRFIIDAAFLGVAGGSDRLVYGYWNNGTPTYYWIWNRSPQQFCMQSGYGFGWSSSATDPINNPCDTILLRDAANTLGMRNGANAQAFQIYDTYTDASNYERGFLGFASNCLWLYSTQAGTGAAQPVKIGTTGSAQLDLFTANSVRWTVNSSGHLVGGTDNTYDVGITGARVRNVLAGGAITAGAAIRAGNGEFLGFATQGGLISSGDGLFRFANNSDTGVARVMWGGTSASFPALKRSSTTLQVRLADDSGDAPLSANDLTLSKTITAGGTTGTQTINKASGSVNFVAAAQTLVVTNSLVTANSVIMATVATDDTTAFACKAIPASGQFTLKLNAAATAETRVSFLVTN